MKYPIGTKLIFEDIKGVVVENFKLPGDICIEWETGQIISYGHEWLDKFSKKDTIIENISKYS